MAWIKAYELKPFVVFDVKLNENFDVRSKIGISSLKKVDLFYSFKKIDTTSYEYDATINQTGTFPSFKFTSGTGVTNNSIINVLAIAKEW